MQNIFYLLSPFVFLGSSEFRGYWLIGVLRSFLRIGIIFTSAFVLTWALVAKVPFFSTDSADMLARHVCLVFKTEAKSCDSEGRESIVGDVPLAPLGLHNKTFVDEKLKKIHESINPVPASLVLQIRGNNKQWQDIIIEVSDEKSDAQGTEASDDDSVSSDDAESTDDDAKVAIRGGASEDAKPSAMRPMRMIARYQSSELLREITVMEVSPANLWVARLLRLDLENLPFGLSWPFQKYNFSASPYIVSSMIMAEAKDSLSAREREQAKGIIDAHLVAAPSAGTAGFVWPRRLNGDIQYACYLLFFTGIIFIFLHWVTNVLPNRLLSRIKTFKFDQSEYVPLTAATSGEKEQEADGPHNQADNKDADGDKSVSKSDERKHTESQIVDAPWLREGERANLDTTIQEMEAIRKGVRRRANFLRSGSMPCFLKLDVWIAGLLAMKSSRSGENVPAFVSVEIEAAAERLEAHHRLLAFNVWAIPTLGFIGTVIGIGTALLATVDLQSAEVITRLKAESRVAVEIGVAFDTTLVALSLSFILMLALHLVQHVEESMLADEKHDALRALVQLENILPDDPLGELRDGLAQMGLAAAQVERWTAILDGKAELYRETLDSVEAGLAFRANQKHEQSSPNAWKWIAITALVVVAGYVLWENWPVLSDIRNRIVPLEE